LGLCGSVSAAWDGAHVKGTKEHPLIKLYPQARVDVYSEKQFDSIELVTGLDTSSGKPVIKAEEFEGRVIKYSYEHKPEVSALEILRQYEGALTKAGFVKLLADRTKKLPSHQLLSGDTFGAFRLDRDGKTVVVNLWANDNPNGASSYLTIVETGTLEQKLGANAEGFYKAISEKGHVAVYGINFDTGKASIRSDSEEVLGEVRQLFAQHGNLKLKVEGHTDNVGAPEDNRKLSQARAEAVVAWLTQRGIKPDSLTASGFGDTKPVADNASEEGRAKNRRVELAR
jgi:outer membrane protein OmpA-like peptidoglycan-associated protein